MNNNPAGQGRRDHAAFEKWARASVHAAARFSSINGEYVDEEVQGKWEAWRAALSTREQADAMDAHKPRVVLMFPRLMTPEVWLMRLDDDGTFIPVTGTGPIRVPEEWRAAPGKQEGK